MTPMPAAFLGHGSPMNALGFIPVLYIAGLASAADSTADALIDGYEYGSLSMTAYTLGFPGPSPGTL